MRYRRFARIGYQFIAASAGALTIWALFAAPLYYVIHAAVHLGDEQEMNVFALLTSAGIGFFVGVPLGAAAGVFVARRLLKEKASYRETLLGAIAGMLVGGLLGGALILLSNSFGMDWWDQNTEMAVFPVIPFIVTVIAAVKAGLSNSFRRGDTIENERGSHGL
jgi:hypothetical protein